MNEWWSCVCVYSGWKWSVSLNPTLLEVSIVAGDTRVNPNDPCCMMIT